MCKTVRHSQSQLKTRVTEIREQIQREYMRETYIKSVRFVLVSPGRCSHIIYSPGGHCIRWRKFSPLLHPVFLKEGGVQKGASEGGGRPPGESTLSLGLTSRQCDVPQVQDRQGVSLCVEDPALKRQQLIAGEK